jgi:hypothetical protein
VTPLGEWLAFYRDLIEHDPTARLFPMLLFESIGPRSDIREAYIAFHRRIRVWIAQRLTVAQTRGEIGPDVDIDAAAATLWAAMVGAHIQWRLDGELDITPIFDTLETWLIPHSAAVPAKP